MVLFMLLGQAAAAASPGSTATAPEVSRVIVDRSAKLPMADRSRGSDVYDSSGALVGTINSSDADSTVLLIGGRPIRVPANALQKTGGRLIVPMTRQQVESLWIGSASYQGRVHP